MLKRKIYDKLIEWKKNRDKKCLLIRGARQVGKTYIVREFGKTYKNFVEINFILHPELIDAFNGSLEVDDIVLSLSAKMRNVKFIQGETLIFFDEIQICPNARTALKSFTIDKRYDVIASGSLLGLSFGQDPTIEEIKSIPVGYENEITLMSMDFEEFLWAIGVGDEIINKLYSYFENKEKIPDDLNKTIHNYLLQYMVVGGMPEAVQKFIDTNNYNDVQEIQDEILFDTKEDILRHSKNTEKQKIKKCFESLPQQLSKENKKFQYSKVEKGATNRKFENSLQWLNDSNMVYMCKNVSTTKYPLMSYEDLDFFKVYVHDIGLLVAMYGYKMKNAILEDKLEGVAKGGIFENLIATMLIRNGHKLNFYKRIDKNTEIEFLIENDSEIIPIEVKAGNNRTKSLNEYIDENLPRFAYKLIDGNIGVDGRKITLPHYMAMFI